MSIALGCEAPLTLWGDHPLVETGQRAYQTEQTGSGKEDQMIKEFGEASRYE